MQNQNTKSIKTIYFYVLTLIYILNDFVFIHTTKISYYLAFDYFFRIISIILIIYLLKRKIISFPYLKLNTLPVKEIIFWALYLVMFAIVIFYVLEEILLRIIPDVHLFSYPKYDSAVIKIIDCILGMIVVSLSEELIFRGYCYSYLAEKIKNPVNIIIIISVVFGLIHWSLGIVPVITTAVWGVFAAASVARTDSLLPALFAHYLIDLISFTEIIPKLNF